MASLGFARFSTARTLRWLGWLASLAMLALLAWLGARMFWSLTTPATPEPPTAIELDPARAAQTITAHHPFGEAPAKTAVAAQRAAPADIALRGVIAAARPGQPSVAVIAIGGKAPVSVREGDEAAPGVSVHRVLARQVEIRRDGQILSLSLPDKDKPSTDRSQEAAAPQPQAQAQAPEPRRGARGRGSDSE